MVMNHSCRLHLHISRHVRVAELPHDVMTKTVGLALGLGLGLGLGLQFLSLHHASESQRCPDMFEMLTHDALTKLRLGISLGLGLCQALGLGLGPRPRSSPNDWRCDFKEWHKTFCLHSFGQAQPRCFFEVVCTHDALYTRDINWCTWFSIVYRLTSIAYLAYNRQ